MVHLLTTQTNKNNLMSKHWIQQETDKKTICSSSFVCGFTCKDKIKIRTLIRTLVSIGVSKPSTEDPDK